MKLSSLPPLREALEAHGLSADKRFGQHFLLDLNITAKIAHLAGPLEDVGVLEVGPGPGGLTRALLEAGARVVAVEKDARFLPLLAELAETAEGRLQVVEADALKIDEPALLAAHAPGAPTAIVSNLPYNVGTPLLVKWLTAPAPPGSMTLMFQKEVAERIVAEPDSDHYGRLSVLSQAMALSAVVMSLPAKAFTPPPKVESAVVHVRPLTEPPPLEVLRALERVTAAAFGQRRKMMRSSLKPVGGAGLAEAAGLDPSRRAETVDVAGFLAMARIVADRG